MQVSGNLLRRFCFLTVNYTRMHNYHRTTAEAVINISKNTLKEGRLCICTDLHCGANKSLKSNFAAVMVMSQQSFVEPA